MLPKKHSGFGGKIYHCIVTSKTKFGTFVFPEWATRIRGSWKIHPQGKPWNHEAPQRPGQGIQTHTSLQLSDQSPSGWQIDSILVDANGKLGIWFLGASRVTTRNVPNFEITSNCHRIVAFEGSSSRMNSQRNLRIEYVFSILQPSWKC